MFRLSRNDLLTRLARGVNTFFPELTNHFICPACFARIQLPGDGQITVAHIVPQAADGRLKTFLCKACNNLFGSRQDKWFGEMVRIKRAGRSILSTRIQEKHYEIDGLRVNGSWRQTETGGFEFCVYSNRNSPEVIRAFLEKFHENPERVHLKVGFPLLAHQQLVDVGFVTAAYLMWFAVAGYSWAFQKHLDPVRRQILSPNETILPNRGVGYAENTISDTPKIGTAWLNGNFAVVAIFLNAIAVFPPADDPNLYERFASGFENTTATGFRAITFKDPVALLTSYLVSAAG